MPSGSVHELYCDTSHFSPVQLLPGALLRWTLNGFARWMYQHLGGWRRLLRDHRTSVVVGAGAVDFLGPHTFEDDHRLESQTFVWSSQGWPVELDQDFMSSRDRVGRVHLTLIPVKLEDRELFISNPAPIEGELLEMLQPGAEEIAREEQRKRRPRIRRQLELLMDGGTLLFRRESPFTVHRHLCEVADQWLFTELPALVGERRDRIAFEEGQQNVELRSILRTPLRSFSFELYQPYFLFEEGIVRTEVFLTSEGSCFVHHLLGRSANTEHGLVLERFEAPANEWGVAS